MKIIPKSDRGFSIIEVLVVLLILSGLSVLMVYTVNGARKVGLSRQASSSAQQTIRLANNIIERDLRQAGSGVFVNTYRKNNGGKAGEMTGSHMPDDFDYGFEIPDLEGFMIPPLEITNGTDDELQSYMNPLVNTIGLTSSYREPGTDVVTLYRLVDNGLNAHIDDIDDSSGENFIVNDPVVGTRLLNVFNSLGGNPVVVMLIDDDGLYATFRNVTGITENSGEYRILMGPSNNYNQPALFKTFLEGLGFDFDGAGGPALFSATVDNDYFSQVSAVSYFVYRHPNPAFQADGWLVRLDMSVIAANNMVINANDPETIRPFVLAEHISDFQVALGIDSDESGIIDGGEWINDENMESYVHLTPGEDTVSAEFTDLVNNLRAVRFSVVSYTDSSATNDPYGFTDRNSSAFSANYQTVEQVARRIGITPQLEDHSWTLTELADRLWYHQAVQVTNTSVIRNLDLDNTFARKK